MKLIEIVRDLDLADAKGTIYAALPWTGSSEAIIARETADGRARAKELGLEYFIEIAIARDFLDDWITQLGSEPTAHQKCSRLIGYARNDA